MLGFSGQMSQIVLFLRLDGAIFSSPASASNQYRARAAGGPNDIGRGSAVALPTFWRGQASSLPISSTSLSGFFALGGSGTQGGLYRQASDQFGYSTAQLHAACWSIVERLCLPSLETRSGKTKPTKWPHQLTITRFHRSSLRVIQTGYARTSLTALTGCWFHYKSPPPND